MPHFFVPPKNILGKHFFFDPPESRHLSKVLRKKEGDSIQIFDGEGSTYFAKIIDFSNPECIQGEISQPNTRSHNPQGEAVIKLYPALYKGTHFEWMLQKVTELGVHAIQPMITERTIISIKTEKSASRLERWQKIILAASKQSGRSKLPEIVAPIKFENAVRIIPPNELKIIPWECESETHLSKVINGLRNQPGRFGIATIHIFIGPEGGFTLKEIDLAREAKFTTVRLTQNILRAETAAIAAVSYFLLRQLN